MASFKVCYFVCMSLNLVCIPLTLIWCVKIYVVYLPIISCLVCLVCLVVLWYCLNALTSVMSKLWFNILYDFGTFVILN